METPQALSRTGAWLLALVPVAVVLVGRLVQAVPWLGPVLSGLLLVAVALIVHSASRGALPGRAPGPRPAGLPGISPGMLEKVADLAVGFAVLVLSVLIVRQMEFEGGSAERAFSAVGWFFAVAMVLSVAVYALRRHLTPAAGLGLGGVAALFLVYLLSGLYEPNPVDQQMAEMRASGGSEKQFERLGARIHEVDAEGNTLLHAAARDNDLALFEKLLEKGLDVNARNAHGQTPFMLLVGQGDMMAPVFPAPGQQALVLRLIENGADVAVRDGAGRNLLAIAVAADNAPLVDLLLERGLDPNAADNSGVTPFIRAVMWLANKESSVLQRRADTPNAAAPAPPDTGVLRRMIARGAKVNAIDGNGEPTLFHAVWGPTVFGLLLEAGADPNAVSRRGDCWWYQARLLSPARVIALADQIPVMRTPARPDGRPGDGPLHVFAEEGNPEVVEYFLKRGFGVGEPDAYGWAPLHRALSGAHKAPERLKVIRLLLAAGADVNARAAGDVTPLMKAAHQPPEIVDFLIAHGADVNAVAKVDSWNARAPSTALDWFIRQNNPPGVEVLRRAGARTVQELREGRK